MVSVGRHLRDHPDAPVARVREEVGDHLEALRRDAVGEEARFVDEVVDGGDVHALREALVVAEERGDVVPRLACDVHDRLAVRVDEHRAGEPLGHGRGHFVADRLGFGRDLVIGFGILGCFVGHLALGSLRRPTGCRRAGRS